MSESGYSLREPAGERLPVVEGAFSHSHAAGREICAWTLEATARRVCKGKWAIPSNFKVGSSDQNSQVDLTRTGRRPQRYFATDPLYDLRSVTLPRSVPPAAPLDDPAGIMVGFLGFNTPDDYGEH